MIRIGKFNTLKISRLSGNETYLDGGNSGEIPLQFGKDRVQYKIGDEVEVFIYTDGKGNLIGTTQTPLAQVGEVAWLKVISLSRAGAFLDWGLPKDLLVPFNEQKHKMVEGRHYLVKLFLDEDNRIAATTLLDDFIRDEAVYLQDGQQVELIIAEETELGFKAVVNHEFWGVLYKNEVFQKLRKGQKLTGFIKKIRGDNKIDLALGREKNANQAASTADKILAFLSKHEGEMRITDKSEPQMIYDTFGVSKKVFKQAVGNLYKRRLISITDDRIKLTEKT